MDALTLAFDPSKPLYHQLYRKLADEIAAGRMRPGERLPSKRRLATHLQISVNTVDGAYQMLLSEGYIESRARSGFFIAKLPEPVKVPSSAPSEQARTPDRPDAEFAYDLGTSVVDPDIFPFATWAKLTKQALMRGRDLLIRGEAQGERVLREALTEHLREFRAVNATASQMVIGAGMEYLLGNLARITGRQSVYALEDPGYPKIRQILENNGIQGRPVAMDARGMRPDLLLQSGADIAYVTPTHQYPMGTTMPVGRRMELLAWAEDRDGRYIVEDDYDSEFRYAGRPVPALSGLTRSEKVVYIGTMSRSIAPSIRIAYMVLPTGLLEEYRRRFGSYSCTVSVFEQHTLAEFIAGGHLARHLNRMRTRCRKRRDELVARLGKAFGHRVRIGGADIGLHLLVTLAGGPGEAAMKRRAAEQGIRLSGLSEYVATPSTRIPENTVVIGYAAIAEDRMDDLVARLRAAWSD